MAEPTTVIRDAAVTAGPLIITVYATTPTPLVSGDGYALRSNGQSVDPLPDAVQWPGDGTPPFADYETAHAAAVALARTLSEGTEQDEELRAQQRQRQERARERLRDQADTLVPRRDRAADSDPAGGGGRPARRQQRQNNGTEGAAQ